jgi:hypothetical protein
MPKSFNTLRAAIREVVDEAETRLAALHGGGIDDISMHGARLQDVFISLTGRELRD